MKVALTGASGHLGAAVLRELHARGHEINVLVRSGDHRSFDGFPVQRIPGDILHRDSLVPLVQGCDALIHCAAFISIHGDQGGIVTKTNIEGTRNALETARQIGIKRVVHISSIHAFEQEPGDIDLDESRTLVGSGAFAYDRSKRAGQELALSMHSDGMEVLVMNPTSIVGPYDFKPSKLGQAIIRLMRGRQPFVMKGGFDFCDCRDVANAIVNGLTAGTPGSCYLLSGKWYSLGEFVTILSEATGKRIPVITLSPLFARVGLPFISAWARISRSEPLYTDEALKAVSSGHKRINSAKAARELGFQARPLSETLCDTVEWFRKSGYLE